MLRDITNIIGHPVVLIAALLLGCYLFFFSGYNDAGPRMGLNERNERNERNEKIFNPPSSINYVNSATAGQQDSRTAGQQDSRTAGQQDSRTAAAGSQQSMLLPGRQPRRRPCPNPPPTKRFIRRDTGSVSKRSRLRLPLPLPTILSPA